MNIYKITNQLNRKAYIGLETKGKFSRWKSHKRNMNCLDGAIHRALRKYGVDNFKCEIIDSAKTLPELIYKEIFWIKEHKTYGPGGYNNSRGGELALNIPPEDFTEEILNEIRQVWRDWSIKVNKARWEKTTPEERQKLCSHLHSEESNQKRSKTVGNEWANMPIKERAEKLRGLKTQWNERNYEEKCKITERKNCFRRKSWRIISPDGNEVIVNGLKEIAIDIGVDANNIASRMRYANSQNRDHIFVNNWTIYRENDGEFI